jgi:hypothetical protein
MCSTKDKFSKKDNDPSFVNISNMRSIKDKLSKKKNDPALIRLLRHSRRDPTKTIGTVLWSFTLIMIFSMFSGLQSSFRLGILMASSRPASNGGSLTFEQSKEMTDSLSFVKTATTLATTTSPTPNSSDVPTIGYTVDIISIGSNTRPEYLTAQRETWGSHPLIRNFFVATEADDIDPACQSQPRNLTVQWQDFCRATYKYNETASPPQNTTHVMHWYSTSLFSAYYLDQKPNPVGYLCAQVCEPKQLECTDGISTYAIARRAEDNGCVLILLLWDGAHYHVC